MDAKRTKQAYATLLDELAKRRLGYGGDRWLCVHCREMLGDAGFEDLRDGDSMVATGTESVYLRARLRAIYHGKDSRPSELVPRRMVGTEETTRR